MDIENNASAYQMMKKLMTETENRIRSAYNYGFKDGVEQGKAEAIESIVKYSMDKYAESEGIQLQGNDDSPCNTCEYFHTVEEALPCCECMYSKVSKYRRAEQ